MCLIYLLLFGCCCSGERSGNACYDSCTASLNGCSCRSGCCGSARTGGCGSSRSLCSCRNCSGYGRHGGVSVCCDAEYYDRQYALCCNCSARCCD